MKTKRYMILLMCLLMCFGLVFSANAASDLTAKQLIMDRLNNIAEYVPSGDINKNAYGSTEIKVKSFNGLAAYFAGFARPLQKLAGSELKIDYKLDYNENKMASAYNLNLNTGRHSGELYYNDNKLIMSNDVISIIREFEPNLFKGKNIPEYLYFNDEALSGIRLRTDTEILLSPEFRDLCIFFLEAVPDKYFSVSLTDQKLYFKLDQDGFEDVALSVLLKIKNENERFDTLVTNYFKLASGPDVDTDQIMKNMFGDINSSIKDGSYPDTREKLKKLIGNFRLKEYISVTSLLPGGKNKISAKAYFGSVPEAAVFDTKTSIFDYTSEPFLKGQIDFNSESSSGKDKLQGTYSLDVAISEYLTRIKADFQLTGEFSKTALNEDSISTFKIKSNDFDNNVNFINLVAESKSNLVKDENVKADIPVLTAANSKDLKKLINNTPDILLNGVPVTCDVDPYIVKLSKETRIMVPLRNVAEALGCQVTWFDPDRITVARGDTIITMYNRKTEYTVNGVQKKLDVPLFITGKRLMVPLSVLTSELGCTFDYDPESNTVNIYSKP